MRLNFTEEEKREMEGNVEDTHMPLDHDLLVYKMTEEERAALKVELAKNGNEYIKSVFAQMGCAPEEVGDLIFQMAYGSRVIFEDPNPPKN